MNNQTVINLQNTTTIRKKSITQTEKKLAKQIL